MKPPKFIKTTKSITVSFEPPLGTKTIPITHPSFERIFTMLTEVKSKGEITESQMKRLRGFMDFNEGVSVLSKGKVKSDDVQMIIENTQVPAGIRRRIEQLAAKGESVTPILKFWERLKQNPSKQAIEHLFSFLDKNNNPITPDGCFIGYRRVTKDFKDKYTKTVDNSVGAKPRMDRSEVDPNPNCTCSYGYHIAAFDYANRAYGSSDEPLILVKVDPVDVVTVPPDYNEQKMRVCAYEVLEVYKDGSPLMEHKTEITEIVVKAQTWYLPKLNRGKFDPKVVTMKRPPVFLTYVRADTREEAVAKFEKKYAGVPKKDKGTKAPAVSTKKKPTKKEKK